MSQRVDVTQFIDEIKKAPDFYITNDGFSALLLLVKNPDGTTSEFIGPDFIEMTEPEIRSFLENVKATYEIPEIARNGWMDTNT